MEYRLVGQAANCDPATFITAAREWPGITTTGDKPLFQGISRSVGGITEPVFSSFGTADRQFLRLGGFQGDV
jgi:hypothetical protein